VRLFDSHGHLDASRFNSDREEVIYRAKDAGIGIITIGTDLETSEQAVQIAQKYKLYAAVGIHPHEAQKYSDGENMDDDAILRLEKLYAVDRVVAIGEIGLDYFKEYSPKPAQHIVFRAQLELSQILKAPVVIHNRDSEEDILNILREIESFGVVHSFTGNTKLAKDILDLGFYLGVNGIATFPKSNALREAIKTIPKKKLLVETDCPFLAPIQHRGERNEPAFVEDVARIVAGFRAEPFDDFCKQTTKNTKKLFKLE
jgi:TatD DNase family protein